MVKYRTEVGIVKDDVRSQMVTSQQDRCRLPAHLKNIRYCNECKGGFSSACTRQKCAGLGHFIIVIIFLVLFMKFTNAYWERNGHDMLEGEDSGSDYDEHGYYNDDDQTYYNSKYQVYGYWDEET